MWTAYTLTIGVEGCAGAGPALTEEVVLGVHLSVVVCGGGIVRGVVGSSEVR